MLSKILIANRGEIARRIIRTARRLGVATVAVYADADARALHVSEADEAVHIGPSPATESYLVGERIIAAAKATGAEGIHPGYGFLSENADFAAAVGKAGLKFIGPSPAAMRALGGKAQAKAVAMEAGVPVVPGYQGDEQDARTLGREAARIGFPVMIKAVAGGGGRGMRLVTKPEELPELLASAQREAQGDFGDARVLIEKVVERPRHIEVQVFGDAQGNVVHLFERDCTLQRRNQKVIEEAPAPGMSSELRAKMCAAAVSLGKAVGYEGAGTVEFLVEGGTLDANARWYFIEMNTRLQVEHPVTEEITGLDLVEWQLRIASGEKLPLPQDKITMHGHAIEVRVNAEDPSNGFMPSIGRIEAFLPGSLEGARLESGVMSGSVISPFYDSMIAKLIVHADERATVVERLRQHLASFAIAGPRSNIPFLMRLLADKDVAQARMDTGLIARKLDGLASRTVTRDEQLAAVRAFMQAETARHAASSGASGPWQRADAFQLGEPRGMPVSLLVDGKPETLTLRWNGASPVPIIMEAPSSDGRTARHGVGVDVVGTHFALFEGEQVTVSRPVYDADDAEDGDAGDSVRAPINGKVVRIFVSEGDDVVKGDRIAVVEAMKMEHVLNAGRDGTIAKVSVAEGAQVNQGALIANLVAE
ncbi:MAG: acetyl/propionyl/methylcrotonyl-CoA carboxylase subunit alpha [Hyphomicrobiaceae bacterium]